MQTLLKIVAIIAAISMLLAASILVFDFVKIQKAFPARTFVGRLEITGLTRDSAVEKLKKASLTRVYTQLFTLEAEGTRFSFAPNELGIYLAEDKTIDYAFSLTHAGSYFKRLRERLLYGETVAPLMLGLSKEQFNNILFALKSSIETNPQNAGFALYEDTGEYNIEPEVIGRKINIGATYKKFEAAVKSGVASASIAIDYTYPDVREKPIKDNPPISLLAEYTTIYGAHDSPNRIHNIKLIASWADGMLLLPEDKFSAVDLIGVVSPDKGFREAYVIVKGELVPQLGGGACQVATTLYNAVMLADLNVTQRRNHSFYFSIYPLGRDAGIYPGQIDMKFENDTGFPVLIKSTATNKKLSFRLYGTPSGKKVTISEPSILGPNANGKYVPKTLKQVIHSNTPFKTTVTRTVMDSEGKELKKETISSFYRLYGDGTNVPIKKRESR